MEANIFENPLFNAAKRGLFEELKKICENHNEKEEKKREFYPALYIASYQGNVEIVKYLLSIGADPNYSFKNCLPPLHAAAQKGRILIGKLLLNYGAEINSKEKIQSETNEIKEMNYFSTPLLTASRGGHEYMVKFLLDNGANIEAKLSSISIKVSVKAQSARMSQNNESDILVSSNNGILKIILNKPRKKNAISTEMYKQLGDIINESAKNNDIRMLVLTGAGDFFTSGNEFNVSLMGDVEGSTRKFKEFVDAVIKCPKLLVAIVNGPAIGIGVTVLALFDIVYASEKAYFNTPFSKLGLIAESCSSYTFPRLMGRSKAGEMLYFCHQMNPEEARECGLISKIYKSDSVDEIWKYLETIVTTMSFETIQATKMLIKRWDMNKLLKVNEDEVKELVKRYNSEDLVNRVLTFVNRKSKL
ncbi:enoyl-CoA delta isomerase 3, peroxisomal-like [Leptopilina boulardi]|uniref:enoyl-CoA delta isomerase 3, peroxisomal-like n=1 Tax=Leptopilina boulardi TaxID=63433 RepID=UPI0021F524B0|nr:enoyl-CoA delta isomerase 3, peroxisomal-like [Leptopilina boulardi]XP_051165538.1 enoyl-CoA delta isomerase 3, peroxisomal-like [Leptopilina boulardi]